MSEQQAAAVKAFRPLCTCCPVPGCPQLRSYPGNCVFFTCRLKNTKKSEHCKEQKGLQPTALLGIAVEAPGASAGPLAEGDAAPSILPFSIFSTIAMAAFVALPSSATSNTALRGSLTHVSQQAAPSPAPAASLAVKGALGVAAVGAAAAAGTRRKHRSALAGAATVTKVAKTRSLADARVVVCAGAMLPEGRKLRVAVIGGGPAGASTADALAQEGIETYLIERKLDNCKPCGGAIPLCMIEDAQGTSDFRLLDRRVTWTWVDRGAAVVAQVLDDFLRQRAKKNGATLINGLFMGMTIPQSKEESYVLTYNDFGEAEGSARSQAED
eukprot:s5851_g5.t1